VRYAGIRYDRTAALERGEAVPGGRALEYVAYADPPALFGEMARGAPYEASEMSLSTYLMMRARGDDRLVGIPVFPSRAFRHGQIYVHADSGIETPEELAGATIGVADYQMTAIVWIKGFLAEDNDLQPADSRWRVGGLKRPGWQERLAFDPPPGMEIELADPERSLEELLATGELDALYTTDAPDAFRTGGVGGGRIRRLFPDYRAVEAAWYARTGCFPIMHLVVIRRDVLDADPGLALDLAGAFEQAKQAARERLERQVTLAVMHPWIADELQRIEAQFGGDPFAYGWEANRAVIERLMDYSHRQGLIDRPLLAEELFASETLNWQPGGS
jgi:4,5-dihydroxyphthalate decarboxylase